MSRLRVLLSLFALLCAVCSPAFAQSESPAWLVGNWRATLQLQGQLLLAEVQFWTSDAGKVEGVVVYEGGNCIAELRDGLVHRGTFVFGESKGTAGRGCGRGGQWHIVPAETGSARLRVGLFAGTYDGKMSQSSATDAMQAAFAERRGAALAAAAAAAALKAGPVIRCLVADAPVGQPRLAASVAAGPARAVDDLSAFERDWRHAASQGAVGDSQVGGLLAGVPSSPVTYNAFDHDLAATPPPALALVHLSAAMPRVLDAPDVMRQAVEWLRVSLPIPPALATSMAELEAANAAVLSAIVGLGASTRDLAIVRALQGLWPRVVTLHRWRGQSNPAIDCHARLLALASSSEALRKLLDGSALHYRTLRALRDRARLLPAPMGPLLDTAVETSLAHDLRESGEIAGNVLRKKDRDDLPRVELALGLATRDAYQASDRYAYMTGDGPGALDLLSQGPQAAGVRLLRAVLALPPWAEAPSRARQAAVRMPAGDALRARMVAWADTMAALNDDIARAPSDTASLELALGDAQRQKVSAWAEAARRGDRAAKAQLTAVARPWGASALGQRLSRLGDEWLEMMALGRQRWGDSAEPVWAALRESPKARSDKARGQAMVTLWQARTEAPSRVEAAADAAARAAADRRHMRDQQELDASRGEALRQQCLQRELACIDMNQDFQCLQSIPLECN